MPTPRSSACASSMQPACVIVKHANPCGVAVAGRPARGLRTRLPHRSDLGVRRHHRLQPPARRDDCGRDPAIDSSSRSSSAPASCARRARELLAAKQNVRVLADRRSATPRLLRRAGTTQSSPAACWCRTRDDRQGRRRRRSRRVTRVRPLPPSSRDLLFAWRVCKFVKSNAIVFAHDGRDDRRSAPAR